MRVTHLVVGQLWVQSTSAAKRNSIVQGLMRDEPRARADETPSAICPGQACCCLIVEVSVTSCHGAEGAVADEASIMEHVARSATT